MTHSDLRGELPTVGDIHRFPSALGMPGAVGPYRILSVLGEGGFGIVYLAERREPFVQRVALKVLKAGMDSATVLARFEQERQSLALMDHPCITHILDAGVTDRGLPYFVMELVQGSKITAYCEDNKLSLQERLDLFIAVCEGVQHAHQKGIIHRDLKPSNILVTVLDNKPQPKIIDFGIAKAVTPSLASRTMVTIEGQVIGTPAYMSPEQAGAGSGDLDTRTDIYSLGVLLYELLTGSLPFEEHTLKGVAIHEIQRLIREIDPPRPSSRIAKRLSGETTTASTISTHETRHLFRELKGDLDWIIMKAIDKDRRRRYESAGSLADDLTRYLRNETISAGAPSATYRLVKFVRRNRLAVAAGTAISVVVLAGLVSSIVLYRRAESQRLIAAAQSRDATTAFGFIDEMFSSVDPEQARGKEVTIVDLLDTSSKKSETLLKASPGAEAIVRGTIGRAYNQLGRPVEAEAQFRKAYELCKATYGELHTDTLAAKVGLAVSQLGLGRPEDALPLLHESHAGRVKLLGEMHPDTLQSLDFEAVALKQLSRYEESLTLTRQVVAARDKVLGLDHADTLSANTGLADLLQQMGKFEEAERLAGSNATRARKALGEDSPVALEAISTHASILMSQSKYKEAAATLEDLAQLQGRVLGPAHGNTLVTLDLLQKCVYRNGDPARSEAIARDIVDRCSKSFGADNPRTLLYLNNLAQTLHTSKKLDEAGQIYETILDRTTQIVGADAEQTIIARNNYALFQMDTGHPEKAVPMLREVVKSFGKTLSPDHWKTGSSTGFLAEALSKIATSPQEIEVAQQTFEQGYSILAKALGPAHERTTILAQDAVKSLKDKVSATDLQTWQTRAAAKP